MQKPKLSSIFKTVIELKLIDFLYHHRDHYYNICNIARKLDVSSSTVSNRVRSMKKRGLVETIETANTKLVTVNTDNDKMKQLQQFYQEER